VLLRGEAEPVNAAGAGPINLGARGKIGAKALYRGCMTESSAPPPAWSAKRLVLLFLLAAGLIAFLALDLGRFFTLESLRENREALLAYVAMAPILAVLAFAAIYVTAVSFSLPIGTLLTVAGGFLFGALAATGIVVACATLGATIVFLIARTALGEPLRARAGPAIRKMEAGFAKNAFNYLLALRLIPVFPFFLVNLAPAFLGVRLPTFALATLLGIVPGTFVYASVGNGLGALFDRGETPDLRIVFEPEILVPIVGLALLALLPVFARLFRRAPKDA